MKLKTWTDLYPHGTKEGDEEWKFFVALARGKYPWRTVSSLAKDTGLSPQRVEQIIEKYYKMGLIFQSPKNDEQWGYWERVPEMQTEPVKSIRQKDYEDRIDKSLNSNVECAVAPLDGEEAPFVECDSGCGTCPEVCFRKEIWGDPGKAWGGFTYIFGKPYSDSGPLTNQYPASLFNFQAVTVYHWPFGSKN